MKQMLRDACILFASIMGISALYRVYRRTKGPLVRVIVFHDVLDREWFVRILATLRAHYHVLTPDEYRMGNFDTTRINVLVTFDDGYTSWVETCLPVLSAYQVKGIFFLNSGLLDAKHEKTEALFVRERLLLTKPHHILTWEGARALARAGHTIGGHTRSHARLSALPYAMQKAEIQDDRVCLTEMLGTSVTTFAYPFGNHDDYTENTLSLLHEIGYTHAFTTYGVVADLSNPLTLSRLCIEDGISPRVFRMWIEGGYDVYGILKRIVCVQ